VSCFTGVAVERDGRLAGPENMARDAALLEQAERGIPGCRVYGWDGPWISLGRFQSPERDLIADGEVPWVIRPTGGKAVLHGHDVTVGLALPLSCLATADMPADRLARSIKAVYTLAITPIVEALRACGVPAVLADGTRHLSHGPRTADCFAFVSGNDVVDRRTGKKLCGCALRLTNAAVLVQASIPNGRPLVDPAGVIVNAADAESPAWDATPFAASLEDALAKTITASANRLR
jgi:lipoate-protein ligase A